jgi:hypothetical protein
MGAFTSPSDALRHELDTNLQNATIPDWEVELERWLLLIQEGERPALLRRLSRIGVAKLSDRQVLQDDVSLLVLCAMSFCPCAKRCRANDDRRWRMH